MIIINACCNEDMTANDAYLFVSRNFLGFICFSKRKWNLSLKRLMMFYDFSELFIPPSSIFPYLWRATVEFNIYTQKLFTILLKSWLTQVCASWFTEVSRTLKMNDSEVILSIPLYTITYRHMSTSSCMKISK